MKAWSSRARSNSATGTREPLDDRPTLDQGAWECHQRRRLRARRRLGYGSIPHRDGPGWPVPGPASEPRSGNRAERIAGLPIRERRHRHGCGASHRPRLPDRGLPDHVDDGRTVVRQRPGGHDQGRRLRVPLRFLRPRSGRHDRNGDGAALLPQHLRHEHQFRGKPDERRGPEGQQQHLWTVLRARHDGPEQQHHHREGPAVHQERQRHAQRQRPGGHAGHPDHRVLRRHHPKRRGPELVRVAPEPHGTADHPAGR